MTGFLILILAVLMGMTVFTLVRGIAAFLQGTREDLERDGSTGPSEIQLKQNKLMFQRILYQGAAILVVALVLFARK
ncbi:MAG TPA: HIG1 domain-containing protein [Novosphingobium sp.]|nr:HIG1 domain-containing protein [Novosphingobium sp.]HNN55624.1 HIG1 domain-containing protein [Novosphingobium sp.]